MTKSNKGYVVGKGEAYLYLETTAPMISGFLFSFVVSKIGAINIIGTSSAVVTFGTIFSVVCEYRYSL